MRLLGAVLRPVRRAVRDQLSQGLSPDRIALALAAALCLAVFPVLGSTTLLCGLAAYFLRLNQVVVQTVNYTAYPLQLLLLIPFLKLGGWLFSAAPRELALGDILYKAGHSPLLLVRSLWTATMHGIVAWTLVAVPVGAVVFLALRPTLRAAARSLAASADRSRSASADSAAKPSNVG